jgi:hypothetical protein
LGRFPGRRWGLGRGVLGVLSPLSPQAEDGLGQGADEQVPAVLRGEVQVREGMTRAWHGTTSGSEGSPTEPYAVRPVNRLAGDHGAVAPHLPVNYPVAARTVGEISVPLPERASRRR